MKASGGMLAGIVGFEWRYAAGRLGFAAASVGLLLMGLVLGVNGPGSGAALRNGPWSVTYSVGFLTLVSVFAATLLSSPTLLRDVEHQAAEIVYSTSVTKRDYLLGRFAGSFLAVSSSLAFGLLGLAAGAVLFRTEGAGGPPFDPVPYLWSFAVLALPGALFVAAFLFAVAALTRSTPATYVAGVFLYVLYWVVALVTGSPIVAGSASQSAAAMSLASLLDPFGLSAFLEQTRHWTLAERNVRNVALAGPFLWNRLLVLALSGLALAVAHRRFAFRLPVGREARRREDDEPAASAVRAKWLPAAVSPATFAPLLACATRVELGALLRSRPLGALVLLWIGGIGIEIGQSFRSAELGTALVPTTGLLVEAIAQPLGLFGVLFLVSFGTELAWRERTVRVAEVVDATPAPGAVFFLSKLAALSTVLCVLALLASAAGTVLQVATGTREIELLPWAGLLFFGVVPLVLLAVLVLFLQSLAPNRHVGLLVSLVAAVFLHLGALGGPDHPLLRYAWSPNLSWSDYSGFGPAVVSFAWFTTFWTAFATLLGLLAVGARRRGTDSRLALRLRALPRRLGRGGRIAAVACAGLVVAVGGLAFRETNLTNRYETDALLAAWKAGYEKAYKPTEGLAQPVATDLAATADLFPDERRFRMKGRLRLANLTTEEIPAVFLVVKRDVKTAVLALAGAAAAEVDERFGVHRFPLARPMRPGEALDLDFDLVLARHGPKADGDDDDLVSNGSWIHGMAVLPTVGYRKSYELVDEADRRRAGLPERPEEDPAESDVPADAGRMTFDVTVTTPADQLPVSPGVLVSSAVASGRRTSRFRAETPVTAFFAVASARYAVERVRHAGVDVEVCFHPGHRRNVAGILEAATRALDHCVARYGPYPFPALRLAEVPTAALGGGGFALPGVVYLSESRAFLIDTAAPGRIDLLTKRVAHEVAHQWWGHQLSPAPGPGSTALVESLARHTELRVLKERRGAEALRPVLDRELQRYLSGRTDGNEVPLVDVRHQAYLYYSKGSLAMAALTEIAGEEAVDGALRDLFRGTTLSGRAPTSRDLLDRLLRATPAEHRPLVEEWWTRIVLCDLRVASATATVQPDRRRRVDVALEARRADATDGEEKEVPFDATVEVVVTSAEPGPDGNDAPPLYSGRHRVTGSNRLSLLVDGRPGGVVVDPRHLFLDRNRTDNEKRIASTESGPEGYGRAPDPAAPTARAGSRRAAP